LTKTKISPQEVQSRLGQLAGKSDWFVVTQDRITAFGGLTLDFDPHHIDPASALTGPFGIGTAQGFLTLSLLPHFIATADFYISHNVHINYGLNRVRFISPVEVGGRIRAEFFYRAVEQRPDGRWIIELETCVEQEGKAKPCLAAEWLILVDQNSSF
jgi:acyl dehydratase